MIPVVIGTNPGRRPWLNDCLTSIRATTKRRRVFVHRTGGYELAALRAGTTRFKKFLYLHDSVEILHKDFWETIDAALPSWLFGAPHMYLAVYNTSDLISALAEAPQTLTKADSIAWESELGTRIRYPILWPDVIDTTGRYEERHGRTNLVLENELIRKWKGNWGQV